MGCFLEVQAVVGLDLKRDVEGVMNPMNIRHLLE